MQSDGDHWKTEGGKHFSLFSLSVILRYNHSNLFLTPLVTQHKDKWQSLMPLFNKIHLKT